jgi:hypothetical protein
MSVGEVWNPAPSIETEILAAAIVLWRTGVNGTEYKCFLDERDTQRLIEEFGEPPPTFTFARFELSLW